MLCIGLIKCYGSRFYFVHIINIVFRDCCVILAARLCIEFMAVMKAETHIITSITASPIGRNVILVIVYVETLITNVIVFIGNIIMCLTSHWQIIFSIHQLVDTDNITWWDQKKNVKNNNKWLIDWLIVASIFSGFLCEI